MVMGGDDIPPWCLADSLRLTVLHFVTLLSCFSLRLLLWFRSFGVSLSLCVCVFCSLWKGKGYIYAFIVYLAGVLFIHLYAK